MHGEYKVPGGKLVVVDCEVEDGKVRQAQVTGDFFLEPAEALADISQALDDIPVELDEQAIADRIRSVLSRDVEMIGFSPEAVAVALRRAVA